MQDFNTKLVLGKWKISWEQYTKSVRSLEFYGDMSHQIASNFSTESEFKLLYQSLWKIYATAAFEAGRQTIVYLQCLTHKKKMLDEANRNHALYMETKHLVVGRIKEFEMNDKTHQWFVGAIHKADLDSQSLVI